MSRWLPEEQACLAELRMRLKDLLDEYDPLPDVIGDRRLIRFIRSKQHKMDEVVPIYASFLKWRRENEVDFIRHDILYGGKNTPFLFPFGKVIIDLAPQIVITPLARDFKGQPLALEQYCFSPKDVLKTITIEQYLVFLIYALEYRALVLEQLSHEAEKQWLKDHENDLQDGYGVILLDFTIRDMKGLSMAHIGAEGRALVRAALNVGLVNYPECLGKCHFINVPWIFSSMWYFVKGMLDEQTLEKISLSGSDNLSVLLKDMSLDNIPTSLGGRFASYNEPFQFDLSNEGPFYYDGIEEDLKSKYPTIWSTYQTKSAPRDSLTFVPEETASGINFSQVGPVEKVQDSEIYPLSISSEPAPSREIEEHINLFSYVAYHRQYEFSAVVGLMGVAFSLNKATAAIWFCYSSFIVILTACMYRIVKIRGL